jgi:hypothetical protein
MNPFQGRVDGDCQAHLQEPAHPAQGGGGAGGGHAPIERKLGTSDSCQPPPRPRSPRSGVPGFSSGSGHAGAGERRLRSAGAPAHGEALVNPEPWRLSDLARQNDLSSTLGDFGTQHGQACPARGRTRALLRGDCGLFEVDCPEELDSRAAPTGPSRPASRWGLTAAPRPRGKMRGMRTGPGDAAAAGGREMNSSAIKRCHPWTDQALQSLESAAIVDRRVELEGKSASLWARTNLTTMRIPHKSEGQLLR